MSNTSRSSRCSNGCYHLSTRCQAGSSKRLIMRYKHIRNRGKFCPVGATSTEGVSIVVLTSIALLTYPQARIRSLNFDHLKPSFMNDIAAMVPRIPMREGKERNCFPCHHECQQPRSIWLRLGNVKFQCETGSKKVLTPKEITITKNKGGSHPLRRSPC